MRHLNDAVAAAANIVGRDVFSNSSAKRCVITYMLYLSVSRLKIMHLASIILSRRVFHFQQFCHKNF